MDKIAHLINRPRPLERERNIIHYTLCGRGAMLLISCAIDYLHYKGTARVERVVVDKRTPEANWQMFSPTTRMSFLAFT